MNEARTIPDLGRQMHVAVFIVEGLLSQVKAARLVKAVMERINMNAGGPPAAWTFPVNGRGGVGFTFVQPITESFIVVDAWRDRKTFYLFIASCLEFDSDRVRTMLVELAAEYGLGRIALVKTRIGEEDFERC
ncbi:MAG: hypothetical protein C4575_09605 [Desulforudis sp.]|nr:MAG: hypothetical protein C4575_09605 [Desulforudis sp.]